MVDIPKDVTAPNIKISYDYPASVKMRSYSPVLRGHPGQMKKALDLILSAKRPMIYTGGGVVLDDAADELVRFTRALGYPITNTLMGLGAYPGTDPQFIGMLGMHGTYEANMAMHHCDVLIGIGARFDDRVVGDVTSSARGAHRPHRHRSRLDLEDGQGARPHRRLGLQGARRDERDAGGYEPPSRCAGALRVVGPNQSLEID